ncbi:hypothetical protein NDU88_000723 [Pleurodeles waltl]|uniref:Uncharacterized protein n=1 Tax=Pleurodeles waltl TaxID=8319 RepID=A0AAV7VVJ8_PLEWA|nr:hypothetical protein NDU88_000723 [Pleurodeles waltl]
MGGGKKPRRKSPTPTACSSRQQEANTEELNRMAEQNIWAKTQARTVIQSRAVNEKQHTSWLRTKSSKHTIHLHIDWLLRQD